MFGVCCGPSLRYHSDMHGSRSSTAIVLGLALVLGIDMVGTQTQPASEVAGRWRLVSASAPPNTAMELTVTGPRASGLLSIERGYATELVTEMYRVDAPPAGAEFEAKRVGNTLVLRSRAGSAAAPRHRRRTAKRRGQSAPRVSSLSM